MNQSECFIESYKGYQNKIVDLLKIKEAKQL